MTDPAYNDQSGSGTHPERRIEAVWQLVERSPRLRQSLYRYEKESALLSEGMHNRHIHLLLEGTVELRKAHTTAGHLCVDSLQPGELIGLYSFVTREPSLTSAVTVTGARTLKFDETAFTQLDDSEPDLYRHLQFLITENLANRYRRMVLLHQELARVNSALESERNELRRTIEALNKTRNQLVTQGKLATLGHLTAGLAHEMNNPTAALQRATEFLRDAIAPMISGAAGPDSDRADTLWSAGLDHAAPATNTQRDSRESLARRFPRWPASLIRRISQLPPDCIERVIEQTDTSDTGGAVVERLRYYEAGRFLRTIRLGADRIAGLVSSLRNYSRGSEGGGEEIDVREGLQDTLLLLGNRLKGIAVAFDCPDPLPAVRANAGELNQVWTNLLINSCDAMKGEGSIRIAASTQEAGTLELAFHDSGPGIPPDLHERIFETNFTTKKGKGHSFGLGLGLSISRDIIAKHGGTITADESPLGGACIRVRLPTV